jgi:hypothetical protein
MPKVYLAAQFESRFDLHDLADQIRDLGYEIVSDWLYEPESNNEIADKIGTEDAPAKLLEHIALNDVSNVVKCDYFVLFSGGGRGGRHFETGLAYKSGATILIVGDRENVFHYLPNVHMLENRRMLVNFFEIRNQYD